MSNEMSLSAFCGNRLPPPNPNATGAMSNIVQYCRYQSQIKALDQKGSKQFNTSGNDTKISRAIRFSQIIRTNSANIIVNQR